MDNEKVGEFLTKLRREQAFSQEELGEKIGVTNKTISRWETGKYLPPVDKLEALSDLYGITINEILSGKRLSDAEYKNLAEENIKETLGASTFTIKEKVNFFKKKWKKDHAIVMIFQIMIIAIVVIAGVKLQNHMITIGLICACGWCIEKYNQMMAYVERNVFK